MSEGVFRIRADFKPTGDQPDAIGKLVAGLSAGEKYQTLLGVTGSGKTFTMANIMAEAQRPALVIAHNKTLAAQLCTEFREFFLGNAVEYFVSYYDYYQPEAYLPASDTYIEKDSATNAEIERLRHAATTALLTRRDTVVVASVSAIYGLGSPAEYLESVLVARVGEEPGMEGIIRKLINMQYERHDYELGRGRFRVKGDTLDVIPAYSESVLRFELFGDGIERITELDPVSGEVLEEMEAVAVYPASHYVISRENLERAITDIEGELAAQLKKLERQGKDLEAYRLRQRTMYDIEMMRETGFCKGVENYSRHIDGRREGEPPYTLLDYFPEDFLLFIDESHNTVPQIGGMVNGDRSRKQPLIEYGFRLPSALDNRPLTYAEFDARIRNVVFVSATPGPYELSVSTNVVEQLIRPTGLIDPEVVVRPIEGQIDDLMNECRKRVEREERVLVTTLTKKMAEDLTDYLTEMGIRARYLHSDIDSIERTVIIRDLRLGMIDVLVGINLLREGLDLPEVSLVAILDADKEGFLRGETALIQTIGRASRHVEGTVIMYADKRTKAMATALSETERRRTAQRAYNEERGIVPKGIIKPVALPMGGEPLPDYGRKRRGSKGHEPVDPAETAALIVRLEEEMLLAAEELKFEYAAKLRDEIERLRREIGMEALWQAER